MEINACEIVGCLDFASRRRVQLLKLYSRRIKVCGGGSASSDQDWLKFRIFCECAFGLVDRNDASLFGGNTSFRFVYLGNLHIITKSAREP